MARMALSNVLNAMQRDENGEGYRGKTIWLAVM
jgi:hypothetical protein